MEGIRLLVLRLTERCNLRCAYCYAARDGETPFDMDEDTALRAVELCCPPGRTLRVQFTGGEPLLKLELMEAVAAFGRESGRKLLLSVQTNGTLLTAEVCRRLKAIRCGVGVSLDGPGEANALRVFPDGRVSTESVVQGIQNLGEAGMRCGMTTVVTAVNAARLGELPDLALWLGNVAGVGLDLFRPLGRGAGRDLSPAPAKLAPFSLADSGGISGGPLARARQASRWTKSIVAKDSGPVLRRDPLSVSGTGAYQEMPKLNRMFQCLLLCPDRSVSGGGRKGPVLALLLSGGPGGFFAGQYLGRPAGTGGLRQAGTGSSSVLPGMRVLLSVSGRVSGGQAGAGRS